jgi:hypothetical protein
MKQGKDPSEQGWELWIPEQVAYFTWQNQPIVEKTNPVRGDELCGLSHSASIAVCCAPVNLSPAFVAH